MLDAGTSRGRAVRVIALLASLATVPAHGQSNGASKKVLSVSDYARWRSIEGAQISGDGHWVTYGLRFTNTVTPDAKPVLHILRLDTGKDVAISNATNASFSADSKWIVYQIDSVGAGPRGRAGAGSGAPGPGGDSAAVAPGTPPVVPSAVAAPAAGAVPVAPAPAGAPTATPVPPVVAPPGLGGRSGGAPPAAPRRFELRELATGKTHAWQDMQTAMFSPSSSHLVLKRRAPGDSAGRGAGAGPGGPPSAGPAAGGNVAASNKPRGVDVIVHNLATGRSQMLGSVGDVSFNRKGDLLAYTVDAIARDGNGLFVLELASGRTTVLDNDARNYNRLAWSDDGNGIVVLKGREVEKTRERDNLLVVFTGVRAAQGDIELAPVTLDPGIASGFPRGWVVSDRAPVSWSGDNKRVFFGIMPQTAVPDSGRRRSTDSIADVDVWRSSDQRIQSVQMIRADADRNFTFRSAFDVATSKYVALADSSLRDVEVSLDGRWAVGRDARAYVSDYKRPAADIYRVSTATGERTLMLKGQLTGSHVFGVSPDGRRFLYWKDNRHHAFDLDAMTAKPLGDAGAPSFADMEFDHPGPKPSYGIAGYSMDGKWLIAHARYDLWQLSLDGAAPARNLTNGVGAKSETRFRIARTMPIDSSASRRARAGQEIDLAKPITLSAYGEYTKKSGYHSLASGQLREIVFDDAVFSTPVRAAKADKYLFTRQTFLEFPDLRVSGADFRESKKITDANPQQAEYVWGRRMLFDFMNRDGLRLQGILALPDDYKAGERRPMIVNFYEKNSQNLHRYTPPTFLTGMGASPIEAVSRGYITMLPDIHFRTGSSHSDMLEAVEAATKKVIEMGYADPQRIGLNGHSFGGEGAAFIGTRSKMFAAVGMGAGVTDLFTDFSQSWGWSYQVSGGSGANGNDYYLYGQGRWGVSPWDKPDLFRNESALTHARDAAAPFLIMHGTADPTVAFSEGLNFYNALRYNDKSAILLAYPGEGHGLRGVANRRDLTIRFFQFFDHHLRGAPAARWMTHEVPFLAKDALRDPVSGALIP